VKEEAERRQIEREEEVKRLRGGREEVEWR
jgi:hypothetical protein